MVILFQPDIHVRGNHDSFPVPFSMLDLVSVPEGLSVDYAINKSKEVASAADQAGFKRIWLAEHQGMKGVASAATSVMIAALGSVTKNIRIGAGGIMLPNHSPMMVAEQFGTLEALYPGRIDLGLGRAPGMDLETARALRRSMQNDVERYPADIQELQCFLGEYDGRHPVIAVPGGRASAFGCCLVIFGKVGKMGLPLVLPHQPLTEAIRLYKLIFNCLSFKNHMFAVWLWSPTVTTGRIPVYFCAINVCRSAQGRN